MAASLNVARPATTFPRACSSILLFVLLAAVCSSAQVASCNFPNCAYVTDGPGREVLAASSSGLAQVWVAPSGTQPEDLTVGPDKKLYVALTSTNQIAIVDVSGNTATASLRSLGTGVSPQGLRFGSNGHLYFNSTSGLRRLLAPNYTSVETVASANFTRPGGIAFRSDGSVLFGGDNAVYLVSSVAGVPPANSSATSFITATGVVGLAVDDVDNVYVAHQDVVDRYDRTGTYQLTVADFSSSGDLPQHIEVVPDMILGASCNTINDLLWVSTYQIVSGKQINGKVWRVGNTTCASNPPVPAAPQLIASINTRVQGKFAPAFGAAVGPSYRTLKKQFSVGNNVHSFHFGSFSHELENALMDTPDSDPPAGGPPCDATITALQRSPSDIAATLNNSSISAAAIRFYGEEGWITTFLLNTPSCFTTKNGEQFSDHYINGFFIGSNPRVVNIHANGSAEYTMTTGFFPSGPGAGIPGDPGIGNRGSRELVLVNEVLTNATYQTSGFLRPLKDPVADPSENVFNAGQNITFKFQVFTSSGQLLSDALAQQLAEKTVFALAQLTPNAVRRGLPESSGQSIKEIPRFKYDARSKQFLYTLDSAALNAPSGTSTWEATVISDTADAGFLPHSVQFTIQN